MFKIALEEPEILKQAFVFFNDFVNKIIFLKTLIPISADIFVFTYPILLIYIYIYGIYKKNIEYKFFSLFIFFGGLISMSFSVIIQKFIEKQRPEISLSSKENLILAHIPDSSFPSDHATLSASIFMSILLRGIKYKNKKIIYLSYIFGIFSLIMSISRVGAGVHRISDVVVGSMIGIIFSYLLFIEKIHNFMIKFIYKPLICIEKYIFKKIFKINQ